MLKLLIAVCLFLSITAIPPAPGYKYKIINVSGALDITANWVRDNKLKTFKEGGINKISVDICGDVLKDSVIDFAKISTGNSDTIVNEDIHIHYGENQYTRRNKFERGSNCITIITKKLPFYFASVKRTITFSKANNEKVAEFTIQIFKVNPLDKAKWKLHHLPMPK